MKIKFKTGVFIHVLKITPTIQIEWNPIKDYDFAIVLCWLKYAVGVRFYFLKAGSNTER